MKKIKKLFILLIVVVLISGCTMKIDYNLTVNNDKSVDLSAIMAFDEELIQALADSENDDTANGSTITSENAGSGTLTDEQQWAIVEKSIAIDDLEDTGYTVTRYDKNNFKGFIITKSFDDLEAITYGDFNVSDEINYSDETASTDDNKLLFTKKGNNYTFNLPVERTGEISGMSGVLDIKLVLTLPNKPISHNATSVSDDGKTLTWDLLSSDVKTIEAEFSLTGGLIMYIAIGVGVLLLIIILIIIIKVVRNKGKKKNQMNNDAKATTATIDKQMTSINEFNNSQSSMPSLESTKPISSLGIQAQSQNVDDNTMQPTLKQPNSMTGTFQAMNTVENPNQDSSLNNEATNPNNELASMNNTYVSQTETLNEVQNKNTSEVNEDIEKL